tara:strand:+ start:13903 stop:15036 length:1134 start_codon:yes stop_codon:yes gene_type:complete
MKTIPYGKHYIDEKDIKFVIKTLKKDKITTGTTTIEFENKISDYLKCKYVSTCNSGTSALYLAMQSLNIKKNDTIIMPSINFVSSYSIAKLFGAKVFLADVDRYTGQMRPDDVINCIKKFKLKNIKALIVMYNGGYPQNAEKFIKLKKKYKFYIIEDACHALGAIYKTNNKTFKIGSCAHSDVCTFSLHPLKTITTGEGGLVTTNIKLIDTNIKKLRSLGLARDKKKHWKYDAVFKGLNFRMTDFQAALGISQLSKIKKFLNYRVKVKNIYNKNLNRNKKIYTPDHKKNYASSNHLYIINFIKPNLKKKENFIKTMLQKNIILQYHYIPIYKFKIFDDKFISQNAEIYYKSSVSLPIYYGLKFKEQKKVIENINKYI